MRLYYNLIIMDTDKDPAAREYMPRRTILMRGTFRHPTVEGQVGSTQQVVPMQEVYLSRTGVLQWYQQKIEKDIRKLVGPTYTVLCKSITVPMGWEIIKGVIYPPMGHEVEERST